MKRAPLYGKIIPIPSGVNDQIVLIIIELMFTLHQPPTRVMERGTKGSDHEERLSLARQRTLTARLP